jgi:putative ABC transport system permease protein
MNVIVEWFRRLWYLLNRGRFEDALKREMESHRAMMAEPARFGNVLRLREESADVWGWRWLEQLLQDVQFGIRVLLKNPGFTVTTVLTLALAVGATTAIFSVVNSVLLRPLPFADPNRLAEVYGRNWRDSTGETKPDPITGPIGGEELEEYIKQSTSFEGFAGYAISTRHLFDPAGTERLTAVQSDFNLFSLLGVDAIVGRTFHDGDPLDVVVISERLWERRFGRDPSISGRAISLDGRPATILGVMPDRFQFPYRAASVLSGTVSASRTDIWVPIALRDPSTGALRQGRRNVVARVRPHVPFDAAASELRVIASRIEAQQNIPNYRVGVRLVPLTDVVLGSVRRSLWMLFAAVGLVLAAACANVANLLLARMTVRAREVATRASLGASRLRLVRQFLAESLVISLAGGAIGIAIARWGTRLLVSIAAAKIPRAHEIALDWRAFVFLFLVCLTAAVVFGIAPAILAARTNLQLVAKAAGGQATMGGRYKRLRDVLVVIEVALAFVLGLGAALVMREVVRLRNVDTGMVTENVVTFHITPRTDASDYYAIERRVAEHPRVQAAGFTAMVPLQNWGWAASFTVHGRADQTRLVTGLRFVTPGYFKALGIPILRGRGLTTQDTPATPPVVVVNQALARRYFPGEDPVGQELDRGTIVGIAGDVLQAGLDRPAEPEIFYALAQNTAMTSDLGMTLVVRSIGPPEAIVEPVRSIVREVKPTLAIFNVKTMETVIDDSLWELNLYRWLIGLFASLALVLAAMGLYGVMSYAVSSRMREFAVRLALGSNPARLARLVVMNALQLVGGGLAAGIVMAIAVGPSLRQVSAHLTGDPAAYGAVAVLLLAIGLGACVFPAIRVATVNPATALRHD